MYLGRFLISAIDNLHSTGIHLNYILILLKTSYITYTSTILIKLAYE